MEGGSSRANLKRSFVEDDDSNKPPPEKTARFPKGKKVKLGDYVVEPGEEIPGYKDPRLAAKDRATRRNKITEELLNDEHSDFVNDIRKAEVQYKDNETFVEDDVPVEPFNLEKEREEGYFDENGNYVEYMNKNDIKDAWLDGVDTYQKYDGKSTVPVTNDDKPHELTTEELAEMNRRITDVLEPGETVLRALRRLKGSTDKKQKMSAETKLLFDTLTEDAMKLMENGDFDVYDEKREHFEREAEGYERLVKARKHGLSESGNNMETSNDMFDMFGDDDGNPANNPAANGSGTVSVQPTESESLQNDYVYDDNSGYYYSSSLGYFYDPTTGLFCCAASGKWYLYNEESGAYDEVQQDTTATETTTVI